MHCKNIIAKKEILSVQIHLLKCFSGIVYFLNIRSIEQPEKLSKLFDGSGT